MRYINLDSEHKQDKFSSLVSPTSGIKHVVGIIFLSKDGRVKYDKKLNYSELNLHLLLFSSMQLFLYYRAIDNKGQVVLGRTIMIS